ncbi:DUF3341 domain-containing protein [Planctomicrobium sp. SH661]|uniref:DUF3341 domain-containing protein n=1 Tax=Planctomicrobium sp. SH661 TaxID=3448124 RepID=UPI003F5B1CB8
MKVDPREVHGLLAEFADTDSLIEAARVLTQKGYRRVEAYSAFPVEGVSEALNYQHTRLPYLVLCGGILGCIGGYAMQYWIAAIAYPLNIGGRPYNSWPAFIPVTFECTILLASLTAVFGMLALNGLPRPHHPLFAVPQFARASTDGYFIGVQSNDPLFDLEETAKLLHELHAKEVIEVPASE